MKTTSALVLAMILLSQGATAQTAYRCKDAKGQTVYQQSPCDAGSSVRRVDVTANSLPAPSASQRTAASIADRNVRMRTAINERRVAIGMNEAELVESWGQPYKVNTDYTASGSQRQWIYRFNGGDQYVYTDSSGLVSAIQDRPRAPVAARRCDDETTMRNARVSANSTTLSHSERLARQREVAAMNPC